MNVQLDFHNEWEKISQRDVYVKVLDELMAEDRDVVSLDADLMHAVNSQDLRKKYPDRAINMGIAEANMTGFAAGLAYTGKKPYIHSFGPFVTRRALDQLFVAGAFGQNSIRVYGSDPGICSEYNGGTHTAFEDIAMMRAIPNTTVLDITDAVMFDNLLRQMKNMTGLVYFRTSRASVKKIYTTGSSFTVGKGNVLIDGADVTIVASDILVAEALLAAEELGKQGISAAVIDMFTIKPLDKELIVKYAEKTGAFVTADNHNISGGLGDAVASVLCEACPAPLRKLGIIDEFGEVGSLEYLQKRFALNAAEITKKVHEVLKVKKS